MHDLNYLDETLDLNQTASYHLSIQVSLDGFSFCILDLSRNKYIVLRHYKLKKGFDTDQLAGELEEIISKDEFLSREYKSVYAMYLSPRYTLVPAPLFSKDHLKLYFEFNQQMQDLDELHHTRLKKTDAYLVFTVPNSVGNILVKYFRNVRFFHQGYPLLENLVQDSSGPHPTVMVSLHGRFMDIAVAEKKKLKIFNSFMYTNEHDLLFFVLYIFEQLRLSQNDSEVFVCGEVNPAGSQYQLLKKYLKRIRSYRSGEMFTYSYTFGEKAEQQFAHLLNLFTCV